MLILLKADQLGLFEATAIIKPHVRKDGVLVRPHARKVKRRQAPVKAKVVPKQDAPATLDLFANNSAPADDRLPIVEHQTKRRLLTGVIARDLTKDQAQAIDPYTFEKNGGWFIREKHLVDGQLPAAPVAKPENSTPKSEKPNSHTAAGVGIDYDGRFNPDAIPAFGVPAGTSQAERRRLNEQAVEIIKTKAPENITAADRAILAQYSGTGGIGDSLNEFYTDTRVAGAMWKVLYDMGLPDGAEVLEPSSATGVFMHTAPVGVKVVGVEMDPNSATIGRILHGGRHEVANASLERFARQDTRQFDAVIGNPPFGLRGSLLKDDKPDLSTAESYFIDTALDKTKPGGLVALIVPTGVMDSKSGRSFRERMLRKGQFLGAMRMPNTAFEHAHTGVTTDVIFLRKRPDDVAGALMTVGRDTLRRLGVWHDEFLAGTYFTDGAGAANILGTMTEGWRAKAGMGQDITVEGSMIGVPEALAQFRPTEALQGNPTVPDILSALGDDEKAKQRALGAANKLPYSEGKAGDTKVVDGVTYVLQGTPLRWHRVDDLMQSPAVADALPLAEEIDRLMTGKTADRAALEDALHRYIEQHGNPSKSKELQAAAAQDKVLYRLIGAVKPDGTLSDVVTGRMAARLEGGFDVVAHTLATREGLFSAEQLAEAVGQEVDETLDHLHASPLYAEDPATGNWTTMDSYLSGELWPKLDAVQAAIEDGIGDQATMEKYRRQAAALEEAIDPRSLEDVDVGINQAWIPLGIVSEFFTSRNAEGNQWQRDLPPVQITFDNGVYSVQGGNPHGETKLLDKYLNRTGVRKDDLPTIEGWNRDFKEWLASSPYREHVEELYNRKFRGFRAREHSKEPFDVPGLQAEGLKDYQYAGLRWALETGRGIIAADVGLGKTARGLILARMAKVNGQAQKPIIVVPKSVLANWVAEAEKWFPGSNVLTIGGEFSFNEDGEVIGKDDTAADRKRKYHDLTQNEYDFILISQPAFNELDVNPALKNEYLDDDFWVQRGDSLGQAGDKRVKKVREQYEQTAAKREFQDRTDAIHFDELGVDMMLIDEGHAYKNLYSARSRFGESPKFLGGQGLSNRAFDMSFKARWIRENAGGGNVYMLTATPTKNSPLEIYSMLSYIAPEAFEAIGIRNSEEFIDRFCLFERENILGTKGDIEEALVTVGFKNMGELREIMRRYIDRTTAEDVGLVLPTRDDRMHMVEMDEQQQKVYADLRELAQESAGKRDATGDAHIFSIMDKMNKAATDLALLGAEHAGHASPKYKTAAEQIIEGVKDGGQVVFGDYVDSHERLADMLAAGGIPRKKIAIINAKVAASSARRQKISDDFNAGKLQVVIGNTATMGEGMNLQRGTTDIHHLDVPWEPASVQQRNGRGLRQGNISESVRIHNYLSKGSFDGYRWMTVSAKRDWQDLLWNGGDTIENYSRQSNLSREDMMVMLSANPDEARKKLEADKAAATERHNAERRREAAGQFVRMREMQRNYAALKNKQGKAAARLASSIERAKAALASSRHFEAKELLDSNMPAAIHPDSGKALVAGSLITPGTGSKLKGQLVVTGIAGPNAVRVRHHGALEGGGFTISVDDISGHDSIGMNDEKAEAAAIAAQAKARLTSEDGIKSAAELIGVPAVAVRESYDLIQQRLKTLAKEYKDSTGYGDVLLVKKDGGVVAAESYQYRDLVQKDHDFALPMPEHREKAINAWLAAERAKTFRTTYQQAGRGKSRQVFVAEYPGKYGQHANPFGSAGEKLFGKEFIAEAQKRLQDEVATAARRAGTFREAMEALKPLAQVGAYGGGVQWPRRALAVMYANAKKEGVLGNPTGQVLGGDGSYRESDWKNFFPATNHGTENTVADDLARAAKSGGHTDLAAAIYVDAHRDDPQEAFKRVAGLASASSQYSSGMYSGRSDVTWPRRVLEAMQYLADRHPEIGDAKVRDMATALRVSTGYTNKVFGQRGDQTISEALAEALESGDGSN